MGAKQEQMLFGLIMVLVLIGVYYLHTSTNKKIKNLRMEIVQVEQDIKRLSKIVKEVEQFKSDKKILEEKIEVIGQLKKNRLAQVHFMDELNSALTDQVWLQFYQQNGDNLSMRGRSLSTEHIADFMRNLEASAYFQNIRLDQTSQANVSYGARSIKVNDFSLRMKVIPDAGSE